jgi:DNA-directed RNA polymerase specialized sigma24 family protein
MTSPTVARFPVKAALTPKRRNRHRRYLENTDYAAFVSRVLSAYGRRVANGDIEALPELVGLAEQLDDIMSTAVTGLREQGYSWAEIANRLGVTKQAAHQRWGQP